MKFNLLAQRRVHFEWFGEPLRRSWKFEVGHHMLSSLIVRWWRLYRVHSHSQQLLLLRW